jgi:hypothetical protein
MPRRGMANVDPFADLAKKVEILEQEMAIQRAALDRLKEIGRRDSHTAPAAQPARTAP